MSIQAVVSPVGASAAGGLAGAKRRRLREKRTDYRVGYGVQSSNYWSSTTNANNTTNAWNVNLNNGNVNNNDKSNTNYVWPVRGGEWWFRRPSSCGAMEGEPVVSRKHGNGSAQRRPPRVGFGAGME